MAHESLSAMISQGKSSLGAMKKVFGITLFLGVALGVILSGISRTQEQALESADHVTHPPAEAQAGASSVKEGAASR